MRDRDTPPKELVAMSSLSDEEYAATVRRRQRIWNSLDRKARQTEATARRQARHAHEDHEERIRLNPQVPQRQTAPRRLPL